MSTALPESLRGKAFTVQEALESGLTRRVLQGSRFEMIHPGVYRFADSPLTLSMRISAARHVLPRDVALSHVSNLQWRGLGIGKASTLHFSSNTRLHVSRPGILMHRFDGTIHPINFRGVPILGPDRTFVDSATVLSLRDLVRAGDWLIANRQTDLNTLDSYVTLSHLDGVQRARKAIPLLRAGVESVMESDVRLVLQRHGLPEPTVNPNIYDSCGLFLARGDLVYESYKVLVEYDGWQHERDARQRQHDHLRRERLEAEGWRVIVVTAVDLKDPRSVAMRVFAALKQRGFQGNFGG